MEFFVKIAAGILWERISLDNQESKLLIGIMTGKFYRSSKISINLRFKSLQKATVVF